VNISQRFMAFSEYLNFTWGQNNVFGFLNVYLLSLGGFFTFLIALAQRAAYWYIGMQGRRKGGTFGASAPSMFGRTVNPISTKGADYAHHTNTSPPNFRTLRRPWTMYVYRRREGNEMPLCSVFTPLCRTAALSRAAALRHSAEIHRVAWYGGGFGICVRI
jgi:hypothetical protein